MNEPAVTRRPRARLVCFLVAAGAFAVASIATPSVAASVAPPAPAVLDATPALPTVTIAPSATAAEGAPAGSTVNVAQVSGLSDAAVQAAMNGRFVALSHECVIGYGASSGTGPLTVAVSVAYETQLLLSLVIECKYTAASFVDSVTATTILFTTGTPLGLLDLFPQPPNQQPETQLEQLAPIIFQHLPAAYVQCARSTGNTLQELNVANALIQMQMQAILVSGGVRFYDPQLDPAPAVCGRLVVDVPASAVTGLLNPTVAAAAVPQPAAACTDLSLGGHFTVNGNTAVVYFSGDANAQLSAQSNDTVLLGLSGNVSLGLGGEWSTPLPLGDAKVKISAQAGVKFGFGANFTGTGALADALASALTNTTPAPPPSTSLQLTSLTGNAGVWMSTDEGFSGFGGGGGTTTNDDGILGFTANFLNNQPTTTMAFVQLDQADAAPVKVPIPVAGVNEPFTGPVTGSGTQKVVMSVTFDSTTLDFKSAGITYVVAVNKDFKIKQPSKKAQSLLNVLKSVSGSGGFSSGSEVDFASNLDLTDPATLSALDIVFGGENPSAADVANLLTFFYSASTMTFTQYSTDSVSLGADGKVQTGPTELSFGIAGKYDARYLDDALFKPANGVDLLPWTACLSHAP